MYEMIELTCYGKNIEKHRRLILRSEIQSVIEFPDTKEVALVIRRRKGLFRRKIYTYVAEIFDEVKELLQKKEQPSRTRRLSEIRDSL